MKRLVVLLALLLLAACQPAGLAPRPESDSGQAYLAKTDGTDRIPVDDAVYTISGEVVGDVNSIVRQSASARASLYGSSMSGFGYMSGSYFGPELNGKGLVRLYVHSCDPYTPLAQPESVVLLKTTDTKATMLATGDIVTLRCRAQYEAIAAIREAEVFDAERVETWELDYCRLASPIVMPVTTAP